jgi:hypothetical protein
LRCPSRSWRPSCSKVRSPTHQNKKIPSSASYPSFGCNHNVSNRVGSEFCRVTAELCRVITHLNRVTTHFDRVAGQLVPRPKPSDRLVTKDLNPSDEASDPRPIPVRQASADASERVPDRFRQGAWVVRLASTSFPSFPSVEPENLQKTPDFPPVPHTLCEKSGLFRAKPTVTSAMTSP